MVKEIVKKWGVVSLHPLTFDDLIQLKDTATIDNDIDLTYVDLSFPVSRAIKIKIEKMSKLDKSLHRWYTFYLIEYDDVMVGMIGFKGIEDDGTIEVGYGVSEYFRRKGIATKAITEMVKMTVTEPLINRIIARNVLSDNYGSIKALQNNGFKVIEDTGNHITLVLEK